MGTIVSLSYLQIMRKTDYSQGPLITVQRLQITLTINNRLQIPEITDNRLSIKYHRQLLETTKSTTDQRQNATDNRPLITYTDTRVSISQIPEATDQRQKITEYK